MTKEKSNYQIVKEYLESGKQITKELMEKYFFDKNKKININISKLIKKYSFSKEKLYLIFNNLNEPPKCPICNKNKKFNNFNKGYYKSCGNKKCSSKIAQENLEKTNLKKYGVKCSLQIKEVKDKIKETNLKKYGVDNPLKSDVIKNKIKQTNLEKYGVENVFQFKEVKEKIKQTNLEKYGVEHCMKSEEVKEKIKKTNLEKYGVDNPMKSDIVKNKVKQTMIKRYGVDNPLKSEEIKNKIKQTNLEKYGQEHYSKTDEFKEKCKQTNLEKYGVEYPIKSEKVKNKIKRTNLERYGVEYLMKSNEFKNKIKQINLEKYRVEHCSQRHINDFENVRNKDFILKEFVKNEKFLINEFCEYFNLSESQANKIRKELNIIYPNRNNINYRLNKEFNFIFEENNRSTIKPYEIDLFSKEHNLGIEYNGLLWHSYGKSEHSRFNNFNDLDKNYHLRKTELCESKNIQLLHIFENEWLNETKKEIWKSVIKSKLGILENKIFARKCQIFPVDTKTASKFLEKNHLQGSVNASIKLGLFLDSELVSLMTIGKSRFSKKYEYELLRFANKTNTSVIGAFSKLLKYFERNYNPKNIISYANRRWSNGKVYEVNSFTLINVAKPNYFYFKDSNILYSRIKFQKHKLKNLLDNFDSSKTEMENMIDNGYRVIFDSGNKVYLKEF